MTVFKKTIRLVIGYADKNSLKDSLLIKSIYSPHTLKIVSSPKEVVEGFDYPLISDPDARSPRAVRDRLGKGHAAGVSLSLLFPQEDWGIILG